MLDFAFGQFSGEKLDLIGEARVAIDQNDFLPPHPASAAAGSVPGLAQKFFRANLDIQAFRTEDEFLEARFLFVSRAHRVMLAARAIIHKTPPLANRRTFRLQ